MITLDCEQGTQEWYEARLGIPTASQFKKVVTASGKLSAQRDKYLAELLAEWALNEPADDFLGTDWTERGKMIEPDAFEYYGIQHDADPSKIGFVYKDESRLIGCSPDALVGDDGLVEFKCPMAKTHLVYLIRGVCPPEYMLQVQGQLWVCSREWCDFMSYYPGLPPMILRVVPDEKYQDALDKYMSIFVEEMLEGRQKLRDMGILTDESEAK